MAQMKSITEIATLFYNVSIEKEECKFNRNQLYNKLHVMSRFIEEVVPDHNKIQYSEEIASNTCSYLEEFPFAINNGGYLRIVGDYMEAFRSELEKRFNVDVKVYFDVIPFNEEAINTFFLDSFKVVLQMLTPYDNRKEHIQWVGEQWIQYCKQMRGCLLDILPLSINSTRQFDYKGQKKLYDMFLRTMSVKSLQKELPPHETFELIMIAAFMMNRGYEAVHLVHRTCPGASYDTLIGMWNDQLNWDKKFKFQYRERPVHDVHLVINEIIELTNDPTIS